MLKDERAGPCKARAMECICEARAESSRAMKFRPVQGCSLDGGGNSICDWSNIRESYWVGRNTSPDTSLDPNPNVTPSPARCPVSPVRYFEEPIHNVAQPLSVLLHHTKCKFM